MFHQKIKTRKFLPNICFKFHFICIYFQGTHPDSLYRIPSRPQSSLNTNSTSNSINSNHHTHFWKAGGSQSPITSSSSTSSFSFRQKRYQMYRLWKIFWRYAKWPLGLLLVCGLLGLIVYFLVVGLYIYSCMHDRLTGPIF